MRKIEHHKTNAANEAITIEADERNPKNGNASHLYVISWRDPDDSGMEVEIPFQNGPIKECGVNGVTNEALLAVLIDRMEGFQSSQWECPENAVALECLERALKALKARTERRVARGVEGTHEV